tara:strand:- start:22151 stop:23452 length:1302 start_codon:yes stop_codon:yes gene_type:complete
MYQLATDLCDLLGGANKALVFVCFTPENLDFTKKGKAGVMSVYVHGKKLDILLSDENILDVCGILQASIFSKGFMLLAWDIKSFFSYVRFFSKKELVPEAILIDLKVIERFLDINKQVPTSLTEAENRAKTVGNFSEWKGLYKQVTLPLIIKVVPEMETTPLLHTEFRTPVHAHYEIEGQRGGRLLCTNVFDRGFNPHTMGEDVKNKLKPVGYDKLFIYLDFKQMEVWMLSYLSKDPELKELLSSGKDFYKVVYGLITGNENASESARKHCKLIFIQIIYGMTAASLAKQFQISYELAHSIHENIRNSFPVAFDWLEEQIKQIKDDIGKDYFGRPRSFADKPYRIRNFSVQAPSSAFCLEGLVRLHRSLRDVDAQICFNVHDGYGVVCTKDNYKETYEAATKSLQSESLLLPGLKVPIECQMGFKLDQLRTVK